MRYKLWDALNKKILTAVFVAIISIPAMYAGAAAYAPAAAGAKVGAGDAAGAPTVVGAARSGGASGATTVAEAAGGAAGGVPAVEEAPYVRVVINGVQGTYSDVAIKIDNRILLPFREILTKLGVPNNDEHVMWNDEEETVTVIDKQNIIKIKVGSNKMSVNGVEKTFDVAPYFYSKNNRTYVPVRAISELLDKRIMWEEASSSIFIRDLDNYNETLALLERMRDAAPLKKFTASSESKINYKITSETAPLPGAGADGVLNAFMDVSQTISADVENKMFYVKQRMNMESVFIGSEIAILNNRIFTKIDGPGSVWFEVSEQNIGGLKAVIEQSSVIEAQMESRPLSDIAMGLAAASGPDGTYSIVGEPLSIVDINQILGTISSLIKLDDSTELTMKVKKMQIGSTVNSDCHQLKDIITGEFDFTVRQVSAGGNPVTVYFNVIIYMTITYEHMDDAFAVSIPNEVLAMARK